MMHGHGHMIILEPDWEQLADADRRLDSRAREQRCHRRASSPAGAYLSRMATADEFFAIDMRVGTVLDAEPFPEARKPSIKLTIDFGAELGRQAIERAAHDALHAGAAHRTAGRRRRQPRLATHRGIQQRSPRPRRNAPGRPKWYCSRSNAGRERNAHRIGRRTTMTATASRPIRSTPDRREGLRAPRSARQHRVVGRTSRAIRIFGSSRATRTCCSTTRGHIPGAFKVDWHADLNDPVVRDYVLARTVPGAAALEEHRRLDDGHLLRRQEQLVGGVRLLGLSAVRIHERKVARRRPPEVGAGRTPDDDRRSVGRHAVQLRGEGAERRADPRVHDRRRSTCRVDRPAGRRSLARRVLRKEAAHARVSAGRRHARRTHSRARRASRGRAPRIRTARSSRRASFGRSMSRSRDSRRATTSSRTAASASARATPGSSSAICSATTKFVTTTAAGPSGGMRSARPSKNKESLICLLPHNPPRLRPRRSSRAPRSPGAASVASTPARPDARIASTRAPKKRPVPSRRCSTPSQRARASTSSRSSPSGRHRSNA